MSSLIYVSGTSVTLAPAGGAVHHGFQFQNPIGHDKYFYKWKGFTKPVYDAVSLSLGFDPLPVSFSAYLGYSSYIPFLPKSGDR